MQDPAALARPPLLRRVPALRVILFALIAAMVWVGFDTLRNSGGDFRDMWLSYKVDRYVKTHPGLSESDKANLRAGRVVKGWDREKCRLAWGEPDAVLNIKQIKNEIWTYGGNTAPATLIFTNGILTHWDP
ncbi:MAG: hypothetical protein A2Y95_03020 [Deltaproteobacteria bacterium RBG_13_65_10]|nr:MAG: hypothetical protein A2Y95_03020 [Deltaproteobacteria bacterium RBG_13_65_10]